MNLAVYRLYLMRRLSFVFPSLRKFYFLELSFKDETRSSAVNPYLSTYHHLHRIFAMRNFRSILVSLMIREIWCNSVPELAIKIYLHWQHVVLRNILLGMIALSAVQSSTPTRIHYPILFIDASTILDTTERSQIRNRSSCRLHLTREPHRAQEHQAMTTHPTKISHVQQCSFSNGDAMFDVNC